jgi:hypothetical protein
MKKKITLGLIATILMFAAFCGFHGNIVNAATVNDSGNNDSMESAIAFSIGDTIKGNISEEDEADFYQFTVSEEGRLDLKYVTEMEWCSSRIYNIDGKNIWDTSTMLWDSVSHSMSTQRSAYLTKGKYYLVLKKEYSSTGNYSIKTSFRSSNTNCNEPNDSITSAKKISLNSKVNGILDEEEEIDFFKFTLSASGSLKFKITVDGKNAQFCAYIYNSDKKRVWSGEFIKWDNSLADETTLSLNRGTYYLALTKYNGSAGLYSFKLNIEKQPQTIKLKNASKKYTSASLKKSSKTFSIGASASGKLSYEVTSGKKYISVSSAGKVTVKKGTPKGTYKVKVSASATDYYSAASKTVKIVVN